MSLPKKKIALLHVAASRLGLSDDQYRDVLRRFGGVESSAELTDGDFGRVMDWFAKCGFKSYARERHLGDRPGMASPGQVAKIRALWREFAEHGTDASLGHWLERQFKVASVRFVSAELAPKVIAALRHMIARKGASETRPAA